MPRLTKWENFRPANSTFLEGGVKMKLLRLRGLRHTIPRSLKQTANLVKMKLLRLRGLRQFPPPRYREFPRGVKMKLLRLRGLRQEHRCPIEDNGYCVSKWNCSVLGDWDSTYSSPSLFFFIFVKMKLLRLRGLRQHKNGHFYVKRRNKSKWNCSVLGDWEWLYGSDHLNCWDG